MNETKETLLGILAADLRSLKKFWNEDDIFGLEDGVYDLIILPATFGLCLYSTISWLRGKKA